MWDKNVCFRAADQPWSSAHAFRLSFAQVEARVVILSTSVCDAFISLAMVQILR